MKFLFLAKKEVKGLPQSPGVYCFEDKKGAIVYIGKSGNIRERVKSHFAKGSWRDNLFLDSVSRVGFLKTCSQIEALILEANLIKKYKPKYNIVWRDDKNYFFVGITKENYPRVFLTHQKKQFKIDDLKFPPAGRTGKIENLWVIHDDIDLPLGKIKIVKGRGAAGHRGVDSIIKELKTKSFVRFRVGIRAEKTRVKRKTMEGFVLQKFNKAEEIVLKEVIEKVCLAIETALKEGLERAMNEFNK